jgi:hypothetical protein
VDRKDLPLLLLDNSSMMNVLNVGEFKVTNLSLEETKALINMVDQKDMLLCFTNSDITNIMFQYLGINNINFNYKRIHNMRIGQDGIVFKLYVTPSETQPVIKATDGIEAKKIQNIYIYCQLISRIK